MSSVTMNHNEVRERLSDYLEESLSDEERRLVDEHLAGCEQCRGELEALRQTLTLLSSLGPLRAPDGFASSVRHKMRRKGRRTRRKDATLGLGHKVPYETTAVIMLLVIVAIYLMLFIFRSMEFEFVPQWSHKKLPRRKPVPARPDIDARPRPGPSPVRRSGKDSTKGPPGTRGKRPGGQ